MRAPQRTMTRALLIGFAGAAIILLSAGAALLASGNGWSGSAILGWMLVASGLIEMAAGTLRREVSALAIAAGGVTALAGLILTADSAANLVSAAYVVLSWLGARSLTLLALGWRCQGSVRAWTLLSAGVDFLLGFLVLVGISAATLSIALFGPTTAVVGSFAWVIAVSLVASGAYLIGVAVAGTSGERHQPGPPQRVSPGRR